MPKRRRTIRWRTAILGLIAFIAVIYGLAGVWEVPLRDVLAVVLAGIFIVAATAVAGFLMGALLHLLRRIMNRTK